MKGLLITVGRRLLGSRTTRRFAWAQWARLRLTALTRLRGVVLTQRVEWDVPGHARLIPFEILAPGFGEVLIRVDTSAVSPGTEKAHFAGGAGDGSNFPRRPGYSVSGTVVSTGLGVRGISRGQRVAAKAPHGNLVVAGQQHVFPLPDNVSSEDAAFIQLGIIVLNGFRLAGFVPGESVAVFGRGSIGQLTIQLAKALGASSVTSIARTDRGATDSLRSYTDRVINSDSESAIRGLGADLVFEASGATAAVGASISAAREGGRVVLLGSPREPVDGLDFGICADRCIELIGAHIEALADPRAYREVGQTFVDLASRGLISPCDLSGLEVDPAEVGRFYRDLVAGKVPSSGALMRWDRIPAARRQVLQLFRPPPRVKEGFSGLAAAKGRRSTVTSSQQIVPHRSSALGFAIIGSGRRGAFHARCLAAVHGAEVRAVMDVNARLAETLGKQLGVRWTTDYESILADRNVDVVLICTPHHLHADQAMAAARAGKHAIVEKPLAHTLASAEMAVRVAKECGTALSVSFNYRYAPDIVAARDLVTKGVIGQFQGAHISYHLLKPPHYALGGSGGGGLGWRGRWSTAGGGVMLMNGIHYLDLLLHLANVEIEEVSAHYASADGGGEVEDTIVMWMRGANRAVATVNVSATVPGFYRSDQPFTELRLWGTEGHIALRPWGQYFSSRAIEGRPAEQWHQIQPPAGLRDSTIEYLDSFVSAVRASQPPPVSGEDAFRAQAVVEAAYESVRQRSVIDVKSLIGAAK